MMTIITGNIASGKSTLMRKLVGYGYKQVLEHTTRPPRKGEKNHVDYHFTDDAEFDRLEDEGKFVETFHAQTMYGVWKYGLLADSMLDDGVIVIGSQSGQVLESGQQVLFVLLDISEADARKRIEGRGDGMEEFMRRFRKDQPDGKKRIWYWTPRLRWSLMRWQSWIMSTPHRRCLRRNGPCTWTVGRA